MLYKDVLDNGIRIITEEVPYVHSVCLGIWVGTGSRHERKKVQGVSHFLEHMLFKGTEKRTAKQIAQALETVGGQLNAFTTKEYTCYYARVLSEHFDLAADVLSDMFLNSLFQEAEMENERNVILEEIKMYEDTPDELVHDVFARRLWLNNSLGQSIIGTEETVSSLTREELTAYYNATYVPENVVVVVVGNITREKVLTVIEGLFSHFCGKKAQKQPERPTAFSGIKCVKKDIEQVHLCFGVPGIANTHEKIYSLHVLNSALGGGVSSRLFQKVREERGLTYSIYSFHSGYSDTGIFGVYAGTSLENVPSVVEIVFGEMLDICLNGITTEEMERNKQQIKGSILLGLENVSNRMHRLGKSEISFGRIITPEEVVDSVMKVTIQSVKETAQELFKSERLVFAAVGPEINIASCDTLKKNAGF